MSTKPQCVRPFKKTNIAGIEFKYKTSGSLMKKIWSEASNLSQTIKSLDQKREDLLKVYRDLNWKLELNWSEKHNPDNQ